MFSDSKLTKVKNNVTRNKYNNVKKLVDKLPQKDLKKEYIEALNKVLKEIEEKEEIARKEAEEKAKREAEIEAAWVKLDVPYISQNKNKIYNGCEAASLLMGLQYKGYLKETSLKSFADDMPKSEDDPHEGFVRDIYDFEPRDVPHWIAPDALAKYGRSASGNSKVVDITGTGVEGLKKELDNGNPVVIYATGGNFDDPVNWIEEVPKNVHVMLLVGYNSKSNQMLINDPWTKTATGQVYVSESRFTTIYNKIGKKAVVIR
ncbi:MAG: C39 family peptidase [Bacilli bacterium]|nr:C39 family peptidase [Bacilli bacterium]